MPNIKWFAPTRAASVASRNCSSRRTALQTKNGLQSKSHLSSPVSPTNFLIPTQPVLLVLFAVAAAAADKHPHPAPAPAPYRPPQPAYPAPAPAPYRPPAPHYPAPAPYAPPPPALHVPHRNCSVQFEKSQAEMCVPTVSTDCHVEHIHVQMPVEDEKCITVTTTSCTADVRTEEVEICVYKYEKKDIETQATTVDVKYAKRCDTSYASVCKPVKKYGGYGKPEEVLQGGAAGDVLQHASGT